MRMYNCHVRLSGTTSTEVPKFGISAAEIILLRSIHGPDAVVKLVPKNKATVSHSMLREQLRVKYERSEHLIGRVDAFFGPAHTPLPESLDPDTEAEIDELIANRDQEELDAKAAYDAEVEKGVQAELAKLRAADLNRVNTALINDPGALTAGQIAEREAKRAQGQKTANEKRATKQAQA